MADKQKVSPYRALFHLRKGGLHAWARKHGWKGSDSDPLPDEYKQKAAASEDPHTAHMGQFALNAKKFEH
jgi:hypothetical protein